MIRLATKSDIPQIIIMIREFAKILDVSCAETALSPRKASLITNGGIALGLCFVDTEKGSDELRGFVLGTRTLNVWSETVEELNMLALYVKPEYRGTSVGGKLLLKYQNRCEEVMENNNSVAVSWINIQQNTNIRENNMGKIGYRPLDIRYIKEK